jgi:predicted O-methyltransferase YrrM
MHAGLWLGDGQSRRLGEMEVLIALERAASRAKDRGELWSSLINDLGISSCAEVGIARGYFAEGMLRECHTIEKYYMIDPWRHLDDWNKPANCSNEALAEAMEEALARTEFAKEKRVVLQGTTMEVSDKLPDQGLDFAYLDGDHTLRGITIDLIRVWPKIKNGGILAGDDFCRSIWQHERTFEPTLVFPMAVHFAEAVNSKIYGLPFNQFAILVDRSTKTAFEFCDLTGKYNTIGLRDALARPFDELVRKAYRKLKRLLLKT